MVARIAPSDADMSGSPPQHAQQEKQKQLDRRPPQNDFAEVEGRHKERVPVDYAIHVKRGHGLSCAGACLQAAHHAIAAGAQFLHGRVELLLA